MWKPKGNDMRCTAVQLSGMTFLNTRILQAVLLFYDAHLLIKIIYTIVLVFSAVNHYLCNRFYNDCTANKYLQLITKNILRL